MFGLVTGTGYESEPFKIDLVQPVMPDMSEVRRAVDAVLSAEDEPIRPIVPRPRRQPAQPAEMPGLMPPNPRAGWPRSPSVRQLSGLRPRLPGTGPKPVSKVPRPAGQRRPQGSTAAWTGFAILIIVFVVIALTALGSLLNMIAGFFE